MTDQALTTYIESISEPLDEALAWLVMIDILPKKKHFHWRNCEQVGDQFTVDVNTNASQPTVSGWFSATKHLVATRFEQREKGYKVWFRLVQP